MRKTESEPETFNHIMELPIQMIKVNKETSVRQVFNEDSMGSLGQSVSEIGQIYPLVVHEESGDTYDLIIGSRRLKSAQRQGLNTVPVVIVNGMDSQKKLLLALAENMEREDLTPFEEATAILRLTKYGLTPKAISEKTKKTEHWVRRRLQLLSMPEEVQDLVSRKKLPLGHVGVLAAVGSQKDQTKMARKAVEHKLDGREFTTLVKKEVKKKKELPTRKSQQGYMDSEKASLKITTMVGWLRRSMPIALDKSDKKGREELKTALAHLCKSAEYWIEKIEKL